MDVLDIFGATCVFRINFYSRLAIMCSIPIVIVVSTFVRYRVLLKHGIDLENMPEESKMELERMAARSLFDSANIDDNNALSPIEMRKLLRQMLGKKNLRTSETDQEISVNIIDAITKAKRKKIQRELEFAQRLIHRFAESQI